MPDMLVKLYDLPDHEDLLPKLQERGIKIKRAMTADKQRIVAFARENFTENWANEVDFAFSRLPVPCFIAVEGQKIVGFAAYDVVVRNFFGPTGVLPAYRGWGIGAALLMQCLKAMRDDGYGYCIIGWVVEAIGFYQKYANATVIEDSFPGVFKDMIAME